MKKLFLSILVATGLGAAVWAGVAMGGTAEGCATIGNATFCGGGTFKPDKLPKKKMVPVDLKTWGSVVTDDGTTPPIADVVQVDFDNDGDLSTKGIKTCDPRKLANTTTAEARKKCKKAIIGTGETRATVHFEGDEPFDAIGPLLIFNGTKKGKNPTVVFHVLANVPLPTTFVVQATIEKSKKGKDYGKRIIVRVPRIAGGAGTLVEFEAKINKKPASGKKYLLARCANKRLIADAEIQLRDGRHLGIGFVAPCEQKKVKKKKGKRSNKRGKAKQKSGKRR